MSYDVRPPFDINQSHIAAVTEACHRKLLEAGFTEDPAARQTLALAEEVGEFVGAVRRWRGMARRTGTFADVEEELADVVITAWVTSHALGIDLEAAINRKLDKVFTRGWKDPR